MYRNDGVNFIPVRIVIRITFNALLTHSVNQRLSSKLTTIRFFTVCIARSTALLLYMCSRSAVFYFIVF